MDYSKATITLLDKFDIDLRNGFLPKAPPLNNLPHQYKVWDHLNNQMTEAINDGSFIQKVNDLPAVRLGILNKRELERAMMLLGAFAHAYIKESHAKVIPKQLAIPWEAVANTLKRKPVITHSSLVIENWGLIDPMKSFHLDNVETQFSFTGTKTESWFFLVTTNIEKVGAPAIPLLLESVYLGRSEAYEEATLLLEKAVPIFKDVLAALRKMYEYCDPTIFYNQVRGYFDSFEDVRYEGTSPEIRSYPGGSAAQSSLLQFFDMALGIDYGETRSKAFLIDMRNYMPYPHRTFLDYVEQEYNLKTARENSDRLNQVCKKIIEYLIEFRNEHLKIVSHYIVRPARKSQSSIIGTGGTNPLIFLKDIRNKNKEHHEH